MRTPKNELCTTVTVLERDFCAFEIYFESYSRIVQNRITTQQQQPKSFYNSYKAFTFILLQQTKSTVPCFYNRTDGVED
jgi:hypothetical protein